MPITFKRGPVIASHPTTMRSFNISGTGYTFDERADSGDATAEFFAANRPLSSLVVTA